MSGPVNPFDTLGDVVVLAHNVMLQRYKDGRLYQISMKRGSVFGVLNIAMSHIPAEDRDKTEWANVNNPWALGEMEDDNLYMSLWVTDE